MDGNTSFLRLLWQLFFCRHDYVPAEMEPEPWEGKVCAKCDHLLITRRPAGKFVYVAEP